MLEIFYKCTCMDAEAALSVPCRRPDEDIRDWIAKVQGAIGTHHWTAHPDCRATTMEYAKIPAPENAPYLGAKGKLNS